MLEIGKVVGNYRVIRKLDEGGMGAVFEGVHDQIDRRVAIKVLHADLSKDEAMVQRFANEARAVNIIRHPGIVEISDFGQLPGGLPYIVMEFLDGESLERRLRRRGRLSVEETAFIGYQVASALCAAHQKGIIHRDMKPDNVMLVSMADGEGERTKILDFGIAKLRQEQEQAKVGKLTQTGAMMGTPHYISPEQCREAKDVDGRADVYSLGAMLFHMVTGQPPFDGSTAPLIMLKHLNNPPPDLAKLNPKLPFELTDIVRRTLTKTPEERPTMKEVADVLLGLCDAQAAVKAASSPSLSGRTALKPVDLEAVSRPTVRGEAGGGAVTAVGEAPLEILIEAGTPLPAHKTTIPPPRRSRVRQLIAGVLLLALCGMVAGVILAVRSRSPEPEPTGERAEKGAPSALIQVSVLSEPPGALLIRLPDGQLMGRTPYKVQMPRGGVLRAKLQLDGFLDRDVVLYLDQDARREERLTRAPTVRKPR